MPNVSIIYAHVINPVTLDKEAQVGVARGKGSALGHIWRGQGGLPLQGKDTVPARHS